MFYVTNDSNVLHLGSSVGKIIISAKKAYLGQSDCRGIRLFRFQVE
jgi:hypothetical protein